jgi:hypothetical protein
MYLSTKLPGPNTLTLDFFLMQLLHAFECCLDSLKK